MGDVMRVKKDYDLTEITRLLLKMRDNCVQKEGEMYNDPERQEKYEALEDAITLLHNPSMLTHAVEAVEVVRCKDCTRALPLPEDRAPYFADGVMACAPGRGDPNKGQSVVWPDDFCSDGVRRR